MKPLSLLALLLCGACNTSSKETNYEWLADYYFQQVKSAREDLARCRADTPVVNVSVPLLSMDKDGLSVTNSVFVGSHLSDEQIEKIKKIVTEALERSEDEEVTP